MLITLVFLVAVVGIFAYNELRAPRLSKGNALREAEREADRITHPWLGEAPVYRSKLFAGYLPEEIEFAERHAVGPNELAPWTPEPLAEADEHQFLCEECDGSKHCPDAPHPGCNGWCEFCGGAGQFPIYPATPWNTPPPSHCRYPRPTAYMPHTREYIRSQLGH